MTKDNITDNMVKITRLRKINSYLIKLQEISNISVDGNEFTDAPVLITATLLSGDPGRTFGKMRRVFGVKKGKKSFNEYSGKVTYSFTLAKAAIIELSGTSARCEVEKVEVPVYHAATQAHTTQETRFRLKDPKKCLGASASADAK